MDGVADFRIEQTPTGGAVRLLGDWTSVGLGRAGDRLAVALRGYASRSPGPSSAPAAAAPPAFDLADLGRFDTAGALSLSRALGQAGLTRDALALAQRPDVERLMAFISQSLHAQEKIAVKRHDPVYGVLVRLGEAVAHIAAEIYRTFVFSGRLIATLGRCAADPRRLRLAPTVSLMERAGLDALPIVAATNFFVGATLGFLGDDLLQQFGAQIYSVELIGIGVLRVFAVLITAVILAGRSASSFAAELGAMKMNQEVDAMEVMGVDCFDALVLPRFIAMITMTPLLTFVAMIAGLFGGMAVTWAVLGLSPPFFLQRLVDNVGVNQFWIGMVQAPVMAVTIAAIGCRQGLEVGGDVEQLGRRVTTAVVQALFAIIIIDAAFALLFMELGQ
jgi:phospholipid/cholesterol/gamma-HCH transport system permease protein